MLLRCDQKVKFDVPIAQPSQSSGEKLKPGTQILVCQGLRSRHLFKNKVVTVKEPPIPSNHDGIRELCSAILRHLLFARQFNQPIDEFSDVLKGRSYRHRYFHIAVLLETKHQDRVGQRIPPVDIVRHGASGDLQIRIVESHPHCLLYALQCFLLSQAKYGRPFPELVSARYLSRFWPRLILPEGLLITHPGLTIRISPGEILKALTNSLLMLLRTSVQPASWGTSVSATTTTSSLPTSALNNPKATQRPFFTPLAWLQL